MAHTILVVFGTRPEAIKLFPRGPRAARRRAASTCAPASPRSTAGCSIRCSRSPGSCPIIDLDLMEPDQSLDALTARLLTGLGEVMDAETARPRDRAGRHRDRDGRRARRLLPQDPGRPCRGGAALGQHLPSLARGGEPPDRRRRSPTCISRPTETAADALRRENVDPGDDPRHRQHRDRRAALGSRARIAAEPALAAGLDAICERASPASGIVAASPATAARISATAWQAIARRHPPHRRRAPTSR